VAQNPSIPHRGVVFSYPNTDPYSLDTRYGFSHAPNICTLPDGRLLVVWFSGPFEASVHQVILAAYSADDGHSWSRAEVLNDFPRRSDFDPPSSSTAGERICSSSPDAGIATHLERAGARLTRPGLLHTRQRPPPVTFPEVPAPQPGDRIGGRQASYPSVTALRDGTLGVVWTDIDLAGESQAGTIRFARVRA